jgi:hypothetical protein
MAVVVVGSQWIYANMYESLVHWLTLALIPCAWSYRHLQSYPFARMVIGKVVEAGRIECTELARPARV